MKKTVKNPLRIVTAVILISALSLFFSLCCWPSSMMQNNMLCMTSMSSDMSAFRILPHEGKMKISLTDVRHCQKCECKNVVTVVSEDSAKKVKREYKNKFLTAVLLGSLNVGLHPAFIYKSPPSS